MGYASMTTRLWAEVDGQEVELTQFACSYALNTIPSCTASLPVGYYVLPPHAPAPTHTITNQEMLQVPLKVYVEITYISGDNTAIIPAGTYLIFCGWVTGVGYRRTYKGYSQTLEGTHWLSALNFSSCMSASSHPNNPTHYTFNTRIILGGGGGLAHFIGRTKAQSLFTKPKITADMWGQCILPWFLELAKEDRINIVRFQAAGGNAGNDGVGQECQDALNAFTGNPLPFDDAGADGDVAAAAIANDIGVSVLSPATAANTLTGMANTTFWDKLVGELAPKYMFAVVPYPTRAAVVPFIPGLQNFWDPYGLGATILARDLSVQDLDARLPRAIRAVGLFAGHGSRAGGNMRPGSQMNNTTIGGWYVPRDDGIVIMREAPPFLSNYVVPSVFTGDSQARAAGKVRGNAFNNPKGGDAPAEVPQDPEQMKQDAETLLDRLAKAMYVNELLKHRYGDLRGPVRFDISPGSTIKIEGTSGAFNGTSEYKYGSVLRVSHFFDAQNQSNYTAFRLAHIRTEAEFNDPDYSTARHPLYDAEFVGDYNFYDEDCPEIGGQ